MRRILALTLGLLLVALTFAACSGDAKDPSSSLPTSSNQGETALEEVSLSFKKFENAKIDYTSVTEFTTQKDDAYQSMTEEYLYLPVGAVLSSDKEFGIYTFGNDFNLNQFIMQSAGFSVENYDPVLKTGDATIQSACYVRLTVKGALTDIKIKVPAKDKSSVAIGEKDVLLLFPEIKTTNDFFSKNESNLNYIFLTDIHYGSGVDDLDGDGIRTYDTVEQVKAQYDKLVAYIEKVVTVANNSPYVDFIVVGGDIVNGYETPDSNNYTESKKKNPNITIGKHVVSQLQQILTPLKKSEKPVFILSGNHDDNTGHSIYRGNNPDQSQSIDNWHVSDLDWNKGIMEAFINVDVVQDENYNYKGKSISKYYYYDIEKAGKKTRVLCLDYNDDRFTFDSAGEVTARPNWGEYHEEQIKWIAAKALQGDFDECIVFSHASFVTSKGNLLESLLEAYQTKTRFKMPSLNLDFANRTTGDILSYHHGHEHKDYNKFDFKKRFWQLSTPMMVTAIDMVSVGSEKIITKALDGNSISELSRNGSESLVTQ